MSRYASRDGLCTSADASAVALWDSIGDRMASEKRGWTETLRGMGVKLAHPDDGWVKRDAVPPFLSLSWYPQFNDEPQEGDLIALGSPHHYGTYPGDKRERWRRIHGRGERICWRYRLVRVTRVHDHTGILGRFVEYYFEDTGIRLPPEPTFRERLRMRRSS
jgi:hypothetical protein